MYASVASSSPLLPPPGAATATAAVSSASHTHPGSGPCSGPELEMSSQRATAGTDHTTTTAVTTAVGTATTPASSTSSTTSDIFSSTTSSSSTSATKVRSNGDPKRVQVSRLQKAEEIADRFDARGGVFPRYLNTAANKSEDPSRQVEYRDADKLK